MPSGRRDWSVSHHVYKDASNPDHVYAIQAYVNSGLMPPWKADADYCHFLDERILSQQKRI
jgi:hypothetical protein